MIIVDLCLPSDRLEVADSFKLYKSYPLNGIVPNTIGNTQDKVYEPGINKEIFTKYSTFIRMLFIVGEAFGILSNLEFHSFVVAGAIAKPVIVANLCVATNCLPFALLYV